jgi:excisionase family DNA binding protein
LTQIWREKSELLKVSPHKNRNGVKIMKITEKKVENVNEIEPLLDEPTAASLLAVSYNHLRMWLRPQGKISFVRVGKNSIRYELADIKKFIRASRVEAKVK